MKSIKDGKKFAEIVPLNRVDCVSENIFSEPAVSICLHVVVLKLLA